MTKAQFLKEVRYMFNGTASVGGNHIARVMWQNKPWKLLDKADNFDTVSKQDYKPVAEFYTQADLWQYIKSQAV